MKPLTNIQKYAIVAATAIVLTFTATWFVTKHQQSKLQGQLQALQVQNGVLEEKLKANAEQLNKDKQTMLSLETKVALIDKDLIRAKKEVEDLKKPIDIQQPTTVNEICQKIDKYYKDSDIKFSDGKFNIAFDTTSLIVWDAENWIINGPIYKETIAKLNDLTIAQDKAINGRDELIKQKDVVITDYTQRDLLNSELNKNQKDQIVNLNKQLTTEARSGKMKAVIGFVSGLALYYVQDKLRKK